MNYTISMTDILLAVSVACNVWFLFLLFYDRIMDTKLIRFFRHIAGLWRSLDSTVAEQGKDKEIPHADTSDIIGKSRFKMASTRTTAAIPTQEAATSEKGIELSEEEATFDDGNTETVSRPTQVPEDKLDETFTSIPTRNWSTERMNRRMRNLTKSRLREAASRILTWQYAPYGRNHRPMRKCDTPERS